MQLSDLEILYSAVLFEHRLTSIIARAGLGALVLAVWLGNRKPALQLLTLMIGAQLIIAGFVTASGPSFLEGPVASAGVLPGVLVLLAGVGVLAQLAGGQGEWRLEPAASGRGAAAWLLLAWAFLCPLFWRAVAQGEGGWGAGILHAPVGVLPGITLLAATALVLHAGPGAPRTAAWAIAVASILVGLVEAAKGVPSSLLLVAAAGWTIHDRVRHLREGTAEESSTEGGPAVAWRTRSSTVLPEDLVESERKKPRPAPSRPAPKPRKAEADDEPGPSRWKLK